MLTCCWSVKGGSGVTVVAAGLALAAARRGPTLLVDLCGDLPAALGIAEPLGAGVADWSRGSRGAPVDDLTVPAAPSLRLVPRGDGPLHRMSAVSLAAAAGSAVVVDAGLVDDLDAPNAAVVTDAPRSLLVMRPCYLALRRAAHLGARPDGVILVVEPGRALAATDVSATLGVPVLAEVPFDPAVSRAVDAGLLVARCPAALERPLAAAR